MAKASNKIISGRFDGYKITLKESILLSITLEELKRYTTSYELVTQESYKSGTSAILRGAVGAAILGPVGLLAGLTAKNNDIYNVVVKWNTDEYSMLELDGKMYKAFISEMMK